MLSKKINETILFNWDSCLVILFSFRIEYPNMFLSLGRDRLLYIVLFVYFE